MTLLKPISHRQVQDVLDAVAPPHLGLKVADIVNLYLSAEGSFAVEVDGSVHQFADWCDPSEHLQGIVTGAGMHGGEVVSLNVRMYRNQPHWYEVSVRTDIPVFTGLRAARDHFESLAGWVVA